MDERIDNKQCPADKRESIIYGVSFNGSPGLPTISLESFRSIELQFVSMTEKIHSFSSCASII